MMQTVEEKRVYFHQYYLAHREKLLIYALQYFYAHKEKMERNNTRRRAERKKEVLAHYSPEGIPKCAHCGITDIDVLSIDHLNGNGNRHRRELGVDSGLGFYLWLEKNNFPDGFQTLCFNCNIKKHIRGYI